MSRSWIGKDAAVLVKQKDLRKLLDYNQSGEERHYAEACDEKSARGHIIHTIRALRKALDTDAKKN